MIFFDSSLDLFFSCSTVGKCQINWIFLEYLIKAVHLNYNLLPNSHIFLPNMIRLYTWTSCQVTWFTFFVFFLISLFTTHMYDMWKWVSKRAFKWIIQISKQNLTNYETLIITFRLIMTCLHLFRLYVYNNNFRDLKTFLDLINRWRRRVEETP